MVDAHTLSGRYRLDEKIATGGMGTVYSATDERLSRRVAVKLLKEELSEDPRFIERFRREARAAGALSHPGVARIFDSGEDASRHFIVMELAEGRDLARLIREEGALAPERAASIGSQIADALGHAHAAGVVHRDVKPHNVIVDENDRVKVTDFGIARATGDSTLTATGSVLGSAHYISPEQASGTPVGPASDIYSLGIVLYEMLTGALPFTGESTLGVAMRHVNEEVPAPSLINPNVTPELDAVVAGATRKVPTQRFPNASKMSMALSGATGGGSTTEVLAGPTGATTEAWPFPGHPPRWDPQRLGKIVLSVFVILLLIAGAVLAYRLAGVGERVREQRNDAPPQVTLEDYRGRPVTEVQPLLEGQGLVVDPVESDDPSGSEADIVWGHSPGAGSKVPEGDTVTLYVSTGSSPDEDPDEEDDEEEGPGNSGGKGKAKGHDKEEED